MVQLPKHTRTYSHIQTRHLNIEIIACLHFIPNQRLQFTFVWSTLMYLHCVKASSSSSSTQFPPLHFLSQFIINMNLRGEISEVVYFLYVTYSHYHVFTFGFDRLELQVLSLHFVSCIYWFHRIINSFYLVGTCSVFCLQCCSQLQCENRTFWDYCSNKKL